MEDPLAVAVPFAPLDQSLVPVDSIGALGSKKDFNQSINTWHALHAQRILRVGMKALDVPVCYEVAGLRGDFYIFDICHWCFLCWSILSAIVSALDSIPLLPKILEIVGLGYTI
uniref:Cyanobacterial aminoacyl-tRNA synthetase CAAD domain-containing protein n=1 Tax=Setaria viridis TaxID=4556 RepID=A0A4V6D811_SETVI|nr:hypothetical protein SEVIR_4G074901v2 [Setaria viridis]